MYGEKIRRKYNFKDRQEKLMLIQKVQFKKNEDFMNFLNNQTNGLD